MRIFDNIQSNQRDRTEQALRGGGRLHDQRVRQGESRDGSEDHRNLADESFALRRRPNVLCVFDVTTSSITKKAVKADERVQKFITPPLDPVYHLEIPQPANG